MESVGQILRQARLSLGLTLEDVSTRTRINLKSLDAIEADELARISSRFIYKSFVRQMAQVTGVESGALEGGLQSALASIPEALVPGQPGAPVPPKLKSMMPERIRFSRWISAVALLVVMLAACSTLYAMWENARTRQDQAAVQPAPVPATAKLRAAVRASMPVAPPVQAPADGAFQIQLSAIEQTWLSVVADGKEVYSGTLQRDEKKTLAGKETARIRTGNAGGVEISFNGKDLGPLGSEGQVVTVVFDKNGYEVLEPQARLMSASYLSGE